MLLYTWSAILGHLNLLLKNFWNRLLTNSKKERLIIYALEIFWKLGNTYMAVEQSLEEEHWRWWEEEERGGGGEVEERTSEEESENNNNWFLNII